MRIRLYPERLYLARVTAFPEAALGTPFFAYVEAHGQKTAVLLEALVPEGAEAAGPFRVLEVEGPIPLEAIGVLGKIGTALAEAGVSMFAYSGFLTDYLLVRETHLRLAEKALVEAGFEVVS